MNRFEVFLNDFDLEGLTENFKKLAHISVDGGKVPCIPRMSPLGFPVFIQEFEVIYIFGETEFKAQVAWKEDVRLRGTHLVYCN